MKIQTLRLQAVLVVLFMFLLQAAGTLLVIAGAIYLFKFIMGM